MKEITLINLENVSEAEAATYKIRKAARAIVFDTGSNVALLNAKNNDYFKLPGGGIEEGEDSITALRRECREEIGCDVEVIAELGQIVEYRKQFQLKQISYCYLAKVEGKKEKPELTESEIAEGFEEAWLPFEEALAKVEGSKPTIYEGPYMVARDTALLLAAKERESEFPRQLTLRCGFW